MPGSPSASPYVVSNGVYDPSNTLLFYVQDNTIYNGSGGSVGTLSDYVISSSYYYSYIANEIAIVPIPGTCRDYYIIYAKNNAGSTLLGGALLYTSVRVSTLGVVTILSNGNWIDNWVDGNMTSIAVSQLSGSTRTLYCLSASNMKSFVVSSSGIGSGSIIKSYNSTDFVSSSDLQATELELSADGLILAWGVPATNRVYWMPISGSAVNHVSIPSYTTPTLSSVSCNGIEFAPNDDILYVSMAGYNSAGYRGGIYKVTRSTSATDTVNTDGRCNNTHLELGQDGYIYGVDGSISPTAAVLAKVDASIGDTLIAGVSNVNYSYGSSGFYTGNYRLPDQVDGENYSYFFGVPQVNASFNINGSAVTTSTPLNTFNCSSIDLAPLGSSLTSYQIEFFETTSTGSIVSGGYNYSTGVVASVPAASIDLRSYNSSYLASNTGYFLIRFTVTNACASAVYDGLIQVSSIAAASSNFKLNDGTGGSSFPVHTLPGSSTCAGGTTLSGSFSTGYIATYQVQVQEVNCSTGATIGSYIINSADIPVTNGDPTTIAAYAFNSNSSPLYYFIFNPNKCFIVNYTVKNACGMSTEYGYFNTVSTCRIGQEDEAGENSLTRVYPQPVVSEGTLVFTLQEDQLVSLTLTDVQGGTSNVVLNQVPAQKGVNNIPLNLSELPAGIYLYQLSADHTIQTGKIVKTQ